MAIQDPQLDNNQVLNTTGVSVGGSVSASPLVLIGGALLLWYLFKKK